MSHRVSTTTTQLCPYSAKAVTDNLQMTECGCVPVKPYEYTQRVWPTGRGCAIPALKLKSDHVSLLLTTLRQPAIFPIAKDRAPEEPARGCSTCSRPCLSLSLLLTPLRPGDWPPPCSSSFSSSGRHRGLRPRPSRRKALPKMPGPLFSSQFVQLSPRQEGSSERASYTGRPRPHSSLPPAPPLSVPPRHLSTHISHACLSAYCLSPPTRMEARRKASWVLFTPIIPVTTTTVLGTWEGLIHTL